MSDQQDEPITLEVHDSHLGHNAPTGHEANDDDQDHEADD